MDFADLAHFFARLEETPGRLDMTRILVEMLHRIEPDEVEAVAYLVQGKVAPDWSGIELGLAEKLVLKALATASAIPDVTPIYHDAGDLGLAAEQAMQKAPQKQATLFGSTSLSILQVYEGLRAIAAVQGSGSQGKKEAMLLKLIRGASPLECRYIVRTVAGRTRLGVADMTFLDALTAWQRGVEVRSVTEMEPEERATHQDVRARIERAYDVRSDLAFVARTLAENGLDAVDQIEVSLGTPLRPMAAERLKTLGEILEKHGGTTAVETKYDGLRVQAHVPAEPDAPIRIFSRRMEELTSQFPDIQAALRANHRGGDCIVEGEAVAIDPDTGRMKPFQVLSRRRGRKFGLGEDARKESALAEGAATTATMMEEVPVAVYLFDCLAADGHSVMHEGYSQRRNRLGQLFDLSTQAVQLSAMESCQNEAAVEAVFQRAVQEGGEGIMCKALEAPYKAGNRGFDWIKYKTDYTEALVDTMDLVVIGAFYGRGRRAGWYGALLMACYDPDTSTYPSLCKLGTGFDDATLMKLKDHFAEHESPSRPHDVLSDMEPDVWFHPATVMEVQAAELTLSPIHRTAWDQFRPGSGLAARFPRFTGRWRDDKGPEQATTVEELMGMYTSQGK